MNKEEQQFDPTKPVRTRDGHKAGIYAPRLLHGWWEGDDGKIHLYEWRTGGKFSYMDDHRLDLVNIPEEPKLVPYTLETFPMWAVWVRRIGGTTRNAITEVGVRYIYFGCGNVDYKLFLEKYEIAGTDGIWHPAGQEEAE